MLGDLGTPAKSIDRTRRRIACFTTRAANSVHVRSSARRRSCAKIPASSISNHCFALPRWRAIARASSHRERPRRTNYKPTGWRASHDPSAAESTIFISRIVGTQAIIGAYSAPLALVGESATESPSADLKERRANDIESCPERKCSATHV
jgi:hypothetical protein